MDTTHYIYNTNIFNIMNNADKPAYAFTDGDTFKHDGLTKRERFAMAAMQSIISSGNMVDDMHPKEWVAQQSTKMADALLNELESNQQDNE